MKIRKNSAFTLIELLVVISIIAIIAALAMPAFNNIRMSGQMTNQLNNGKQICIAMRAYAGETSHGGSFPAYTDIDAGTIAQNANEAFEVLMPTYLDDKKIFFNSLSAWCKLTPQNEQNKNKIQAGENDWVYIRGLKDSAGSTVPLLANAFAPSTTTYVVDQSKKGGVWKGTKSVVVYTAGNAEIAETQKDTYFIKRKDAPTQNAFEKTAEWLAGDDVQVLYPITTN